MPAGNSVSAESIDLVTDLKWMRLESPSRLDPGLRFVLELIEQEDWDQLFQRTGILHKSKAEKIGPRKVSFGYLPLLIQFGRAAVPKWVGTANVEIAAAFLRHGLPQYATARIRLSAEDPRRLHREPGQHERLLNDLIAEILSDPGVERLELPGAAQAFNEDALGDIGLSPDSNQLGPEEAPDGSGVVIGIIDDGCALAHPNFITETGGRLESRVLWLWDQGRETDRTTGGWSAPPDYPEDSGLELSRAAINEALNSSVANGVIDEDEVYRRLDHAIADLASHGTQVMDIAAGNGRALASTRGVASGASIIFVQLPSAAITRGGAALNKAVFDGVRYIFDRAEAEGMPAVINISYGGYLGPHNGRSFVESAIDAELENTSGRAVVVAAGNGFEADCHAGGSLLRRRGRTLSWIVEPEDPTANIMEIWYAVGAELEVALTTPAGKPLAPVALGMGPLNLKAKNNAGKDVVLGIVDHQKSAPWTGLNRLMIILGPTGPSDGSVATPLAPSGTWQVRLRNVGTVGTRFDAWIERDMSGGAGGARRMQSRFHSDDAEPLCTLSSYATGRLTLAVGAYNTATQQVARYSACGPTRDGSAKPEVLAPAEEDAEGRGVLCASSRSALPARMNGTSAAAPMVAGVAALLFQARATAVPPLDAERTRRLIIDGASAAQPARGPLRPNVRIDADDRRRLKQGNPAIWSHLVGSGRISWPETRDQP